MDGKWEYVSEGGKHAVFASESFQGRLLRIGKKDLATSAGLGVLEPNDAASTSSSKTTRSTLQYLESIVAPCLSLYFDIPEIISLEWKFLNQLREVAMQSGRIPDSRRKDWMPPIQKGFAISEATKTFGLLVVDYRTIPESLRHPDSFVPPRRLCVELKPKAGYLSLSPLVHPCHRVKLSKSRFTLLQHLHQQGHVEKGWAKSAHGIKISAYEPLDLFSNDHERMRKAVQNLLDSPQNNLKIWYNDQTITKHSQLDRDGVETVLKGLIDETLDNALESFSSFVSCLIASVLQSESVLDKLQTLQKLDILDVDGAILVSERLIELCGGSRQKAEEQIMNVPRHSDDGAPPSLLSASPFATLNGKSTTSGVSELCRLTEDFRTAFSHASPDATVLDAFYNDATNVVGKLSMEDCAYLLSNWLLSLAMCDASIFITLEQLSTTSDVVHNVARAGESQSPVEAPCSLGRGVVCATMSESQLRFSYMVRLIDCDQKPPSKLWERKEKESAFAKLKTMH